MSDCPDLKAEENILIDTLNRLSVVLMTGQINSYDQLKHFDKALAMYLRLLVRLARNDDLRREKYDEYRALLVDVRGRVELLLKKTDINKLSTYGFFLNVHRKISKGISTCDEFGDLSDMKASIDRDFG